jgi:hypothetical protein
VIDKALTMHHVPIIDKIMSIVVFAPTGGKKAKKNKAKQ